MQRIGLRSWTRALAFALSALLAPLAAFGRAADAPRAAASRAAESAAACRACGAPGGAGGLEYAVAGRYVPLCGGPCLDAALADPDAVLAGMQARSGLFDEKAMPARSANWAFFALGSYVCAGLLAGAWCAHAAFRKGKSPAAWLAIGLAFNVAGIAALALARGEPRSIPAGMSKIPATADPVPCGSCGAANHPSAARCARCGAAAAPRSESEAARARA